jgi:broad specificity phosphatase PhoE
LGEQTNVPARLTLISHAATPATRLAAFPQDELLDAGEIAKLGKFASRTWHAPRARQVLTAPEHRTRQTAQALDLNAVVTDELRDCDYGAWQGRGLADLQAEAPEAILQWLTDPTASPHGGESITALIARTTVWLNGLVQHDGHTIGVTHPAVIRSAILHTLGAPASSFWRVDIAPLTVTDLRHNGRVWTLRSSAVPLSLDEAEPVENR